MNGPHVLRASVRVQIEVDLDEALDGLRPRVSRARLHAAVRAWLREQVTTVPLATLGREAYADLSHSLYEADLVTTDEETS